ncbi:MAG: maltose alpha-D-glucosyltransferase [Gemmataceae bacterium]
MLDNDPLWYKDAIIYEVHVRAFHDSDGDGIGDFRGLTEKLDYLEDLGVTCIWVLPFYPSPLRDDGYDIADYLDIHPNYGKFDDFREFVEQAHRRGIRVVTELVINHTSDQHPWFQRARRSPPGSPERDFYVWSDTPDKYANVRIIFQDFETSNWTLDREAQAYFWHRFYHHQPDLNYDNPAVWNAIFPIVDFWFSLGVDGMRLDAVPYLYEREGTSCENLPQTHEFLRALRRHIDENFQNKMLLAEANMWPEDATAYMGQGDECQMGFHFPLMPRLYMALHQEDRFPIVDILQQTPEIPANCQWGLFLRNHDELTLEMVTDEERDYMYRAYAEDRHARINLGIRRRLAPLLKNDRRRIELMNALLFALPGTPILYYGDEIGMGDNIYLGDRHGVRTPMQWSADRNAGFSRANPQGLYLPVNIDPEYHYEAINVESQQNNSNSLLWWMKRLIALRKRYKAFGRGTFEFIIPINPKVLAFVREYQDEHLLVVVNLSRFVQHAELDLSRWAGRVPEEMFGRTLFPPITDRPYPISLNPYGFCYFALTADPVSAGGPGPVTGISAPARLDDLFQDSSRERVEELLPAYLQVRRPGGAPARVTTVHIQAVYPFQRDDLHAWLLHLKLEFESGIPEDMLLPLAVIPAERASELLEPSEVTTVTRLLGAQEMLLVDAQSVPLFGREVLRLMAQGKTMQLGSMELVSIPRPGLAELVGDDLAGQELRLDRSDRGSLTLRVGHRVVLKPVRLMEDEIHPSIELARHFQGDNRLPFLPQVVGHIELRRRDRRSESMVLAIAQRYVEHQGNGWQVALDHLASFFERVATLPYESHAAELSDLVGNFTAVIEGLGQITAEFHSALAQAKEPALLPEKITRPYLRSLYQGLRNRAGRLCARLADTGRIPPAYRELSRRIVERHQTLLTFFQQITQLALGLKRIRIHGDYHLGKLLYTGNSFVFSDLSGNPSLSLGERRIRRTALRDVAMMIRSFDYAAGCALLGLTSSKGRPPGMVRPEDQAALAGWARGWVEHVSKVFLTSYLARVTLADLVPAGEDDRNRLLDILLLERALQEIDHDLTFRPDWCIIPLQAALRLLEANAP